MFTAPISPETEFDALGFKLFYVRYDSWLTCVVLGLFALAVCTAHL